MPIAQFYGGPLDLWSSWLKYNNSIFVVVSPPNGGPPSSPPPWCSWNRQATNLAMESPLDQTRRLNFWKWYTNVLFVNFFELVSNPESSFSISALIRPSKVTHPPPLICHRFDVLAHSIVALCSHCVSTGAWNKLPALEEADEVKIWRFVILCENSVRSTGSIKFAIEALFGLEVPVQLITVFNGLVELPYFTLFLRL